MSARIALLIYYKLPGYHTPSTQGIGKYDVLQVLMNFAFSRVKINIMCLLLIILSY